MKTFGELDRDEKIKLFEQWLDGGIIEYYSSGTREWLNIDNPSWNGYIRYRAKPCKPSIDWEHVSSQYKYMVTSGNGETYLYEKEPYHHCDSGKSIFAWAAINARSFSSFRPGNCECEDSLVIRPGYDPDSEGD